MQKYIKPPKSPSELIAKLQRQGLEIADIVAAENFLHKVSYFRFRGYLYPYFEEDKLDDSLRRFKPNSTFDHIKQIYCFDESLRKLIFCIFPEIEVAIRTALDNTISPIIGHGFWYLDGKVLKKTKDVNDLIGKLQNAFNNSKEEYAKHFRDNYTNHHSPEYPKMPPFWVISEISTLGQLKIICENIDTTDHAINFPLITMSQGFGAKNFKNLVKWIEALRNLRNICAHHGRLWNKSLLAPPEISQKISNNFVSSIPNSTRRREHTVYVAIGVLRVMCKYKNIQEDIKSGLIDLFERYPAVVEYQESMGMCKDWQNDEIWS